MPDTTPIRIFDTTLRDGEQSPGASLNHEEKMQIARHLEVMGVDIIEAGFPITSDGDFEAVKAIGQELTKTTVCGLARCVPIDIERAAEALANAHNPRIHVFCATSKIHLEHKFGKPFEAILDMSVKGVEKARQYVDDVEFSPEDGSRTGIAELEQITRAAIQAGATTINIPDTVGYAVPEEYGSIFRLLRERIPEIDRDGVVLSAHCHNDLGVAVANSLAAVENGARQVECTINGIGERAGNAALEEIVMALRTRGDFYNRYSTRVDASKIYLGSRMVSNLTGLTVQRNKAVVGQNAFAHEAGIHQDGMLKDRSTYEIMDPRDIGVPESQLVLGKHSGRHALADRIKELGYAIDDESLQRVYHDFKELADKKKEVYDEDIEALLDQRLTAGKRLYELVRFHVTAGTEQTSMAYVMLKTPEGDLQDDTAHGFGPTEAVLAAVQRIAGVEARLEEYTSRALTGGTEAMGEANVRISSAGRFARGRGVSTDIVEAVALAFVTAINRIASMDASGQRHEAGMATP